MKKYELHPLADIFPSLNGDERAKLLGSLKENGQLEDIVLHEGKILDGANRDVLLTEAGITPRYTEWSKLPEEKRGKSLLEYVMAKNFDRRHLNASQKATIAVEVESLFAELAKQRQGTAGIGAPKGANGAQQADEHNQDTGGRPEDESQAPGKKGGKKSTTGKAAAAAAKATGASTRMVERAKSLKKKDPKKFADVKAGKEKLGKAAKDADKEAKAKAELADALKRIGNVAGKDVAAIMEKRKRAEILEYGGMKDDDILKVRGLIQSGFPLAKAKKYRMTSLTRTHSIGDLCTRALAQGVSKAGSYDLDIVHEGVSLRVSVKKGITAPAKK